MVFVWSSWLFNNSVSFKDMNSYLNSHMIICASLTMKGLLLSWVSLGGAVKLAEIGRQSSEVVRNLLWAFNLENFNRNTNSDSP